MGKFSRLLQAKGKDVVIDEKTYNIKPLTGKYLGLFMEMGSKKEEATFELILASLRQTDDTISRDDLNELPLSVIMSIMEVITEVNELK